MASRKELKEEYKRMQPRMGVYTIRNIQNGRRFIASALDLDRVWNAKKFQLQSGGHVNRMLQSDWNTFGEESFTFEILHEWKPADNPGSGPVNPASIREELKQFESLVIEEMQPFGERGYNIVAKNKPPQ